MGRLKHSIVLMWSKESTPQVGGTVACLAGSLIDLQSNQIFSQEGSYKLKPKGAINSNKITPIMQDA